MHHHLLHSLRHCATLRHPLPAKTLHAHIIKLGLNQYGPLPNTLISTYSKCGLIHHAHQLFDEMPHRNHVSWASLLAAYNQADLPARALSVFQNMWTHDHLQPDHFVFASLVNSCAALGVLRIGCQVHARFLVSDYYFDDVVKSSLVDMYAKCGLVDLARGVFDTLNSKNPISWTAMISGYARSGRKLEAVELLRDMKEKSLYTWTALVTGLIQSGHFVSAFHLFIEMRKEGVIIVDPFILSSVIVGSANLAALELGKELHCLVSKLGFESEPYISNALVDMYAKCSDIVDAKTVFCSIVRKDVVSWTSIIVGLAQHGKAKEALSLYDDMISNGVKPNEVTFVGLIYACSHVGLVDKGRDLFKSMVECYGLKPSLQHYTCLLDLYSRSGHLDEAENLLNTMPFEVDEAVWASLLSACKRFGKTQMGIRVADRLMRLGVKDPSSFILLSNAYAGASMWENVAKVRKLMADMDIKKEPGYSCVHLGKESEVFHAGETSHLLKDEMSVLLKDLDEEMRRRGYVPDVSFVLRDIGEKDKENQLFWHSERLAVAYGLIKSVPGSVIRVVKNLRVCGDCHTVLKFISSISGREIVVRDASRFHHFKDGKCSCSDFW
ncbi:pentatricopeptide repeat (PPR) superfamily protein [Artemisia annua]|uniref:Pentatricopeptide repeat (PPR) superfamily protein n=1 Tax=Artemisia annua TaxID=35608 RepID=A0A2U1KCL7_ARTAN|nr:pentatricopeptide repeat (PPR) superfamily protein [Artemisia annua]